MEKMVWVKPEMNDIAYGASEYVAACGGTETTYYFECDAPAGTLYIYNNMSISGSYTVNDKSDPAGWTTNEWSTYLSNNDEARQRLGSYHPCSEDHEASTSQGFFWGFVNRNGGGDSVVHDDNETVIVWRGPNGNNGHATSQLDIDTWRVAWSG